MSANSSYYIKTWVIYAGCLCSWNEIDHIIFDWFRYLKYSYNCIPYFIYKYSIFYILISDNHIHYHQTFFSYLQFVKIKRRTREIVVSGIHAYLPVLFCNIRNVNWSVAITVFFSFQRQIFKKTSWGCQ